MDKTAILRLGKASRWLLVSLSRSRLKTTKQTTRENESDLFSVRGASIAADPRAPSAQSRLARCRRTDIQSAIAAALVRRSPLERASTTLLRRWPARMRHTGSAGRLCCA
jgi:hypothetical protein